jgi:hypothetical protein
MAAIGVPADTVTSILQNRPFPPTAGFPGGRLRVGGNSIYNLRATARPRNADGTLSDMRRIVSAVVKVQGGEIPYVVLRWYDRG